MFKEQFPVLKNLVSKLGEWEQGNPGTAIPRSIGEHEFTIGDSTGKRMMSPFNQWMLQRPINYYQQLDGDSKLHVQNWLEKLGGGEAMSMDIPKPVKRVNNVLVFD